VGWKAGPERFRSLQVDHKDQFRGPLNWQFRGVGAFQFLPCGDANLVISSGNACTVVHEAARHGKIRAMDKWSEF
jgi:hypothetical protein